MCLSQIAKCMHVDSWTVATASHQSQVGDKGHSQLCQPAYHGHTVTFMYHHVCEQPCWQHALDPASCKVTCCHKHYLFP